MITDIFVKERDMVLQESAPALLLLGIRKETVLLLAFQKSPVRRSRPADLFFQLLHVSRHLGTPIFQIPLTASRRLLT